MKTILIIMLIGCAIMTGFSQTYSGSSFRTQSYYGFSGLTFLPNAQILTPGQFGISYSSKPCTGSEINLVPYSVRLGYGVPIERMEIATTNTPFYASERIYQGVSLSHGVGELELILPVFPSVKYQ